MVTTIFDEKKIADQFFGGKPSFFQPFFYPSYSKILQGSKSFFYTFKGGENQEK
jgi:hypothetical protein